MRKKEIMYFLFFEQTENKEEKRNFQIANDGAKNSKNELDVLGRFHLCLTILLSFLNLENLSH